MGWQTVTLGGGGATVTSKSKSSRSITAADFCNCLKDVTRDGVEGVGRIGAETEGDDAVPGSGKHCILNVARSAELVEVMMFPAMLRR